MHGHLQMNGIAPRFHGAWLALAAFAFVISSASAVFPVSSIPVGGQPMAVAVNPLTNKIYVANNGDGSMTVIDGATHAAATVPLGSGAKPIALAVNPVTNRVYVADGSNFITVIDG